MPSDESSSTSSPARRDSSSSCSYALRDVGRRILVDLGVLGNLRSLGAVGPVAQDVAATVVGIVQQRQVAFSRQFRAPLGLAAVLQLEQPAEDLFFASFLHGLPT